MVAVLGHSRSVTRVRNYLVTVILVDVLHGEGSQFGVGNDLGQLLGLVTAIVGESYRACVRVAGQRHRDLTIGVGVILATSTVTWSIVVLSAT